MKGFLRIWSYIINPLFIPALVSLWYFNTVSVTDGSVIRLKMYLIIALTIIIPLLIFSILKILGIVKSVYLPAIKQRVTPLISYVVLLIILIRGGFKDGLHDSLYYFFIGVLMATIVATALAIVRYKMSLHLMAVGGAIGFALMLNTSIGTPSILIIALLFIIAGLTASSRLSMKAHKGHELIFGLMTGVVTQVMAGIYFL